MYLGSVDPVAAQVGWGALGLDGHLGYEGKPVSVRGQAYARSISTHPPAHVLYNVGGRFATFRCHVAINDDVPAGRSHADFFVYADSRQVACAPHVVAGEAPRSIQADISGASALELRVGTTHWEFSHAVWLDPELVETALSRAEPLVDCLGRAEIAAASLPSAERCIATVVSPGYERMLDNMLGSVRANANCDDSLLLVFAINADEACARVAAKYGAVVVPCRNRARLSPMTKALLYSAARCIQAEQFVLLDADMLVIGDLRPLFSTIEACADGSILVCREGNGHGLTSVRHALETAYGGSARDLEWLAITAEEAAYPFVVNDGLIAASRGALLALDGCVRAMPNAIAWTDAHQRVWWRNQFIFNLALARLRCGVELDPGYNLQLHTQEVSPQVQGARLRAEWRGRPVRVVHFSGGSKRRHAEIQAMYTAAGEPLAGPYIGDSYAQYTDTLRTWIGRYGIRAMAWSFYGMTDGSTARITDRSVFPLLATLHYVIRSNGCVRVLESGTARGVSAGCIASAIAHRPGARVVTFDPNDMPERHVLWESLPAQMRSCIEERRTGALEGMAAAVAAGERYHAALLDSIHSEEHVWQEFQLATQLICEGGLILIHDAQFRDGTVPQALDRISAAGYGVVRLWSAAEGEPQDDHLGLAVIENRVCTKSASAS